MIRFNHIVPSVRRLGGVRNVKRLLNTSSQPPSHFSDPHSIPRPYETPGQQSFPSTPAPIAGPASHSSSGDGRSESRQQQADRGTNLKEITSLIAMYVLAYIAIDNYTTRTKLETLNKESSKITQKALQVQQANFSDARKTRDLQIIQERREHARRNFKMGVHIAMLRKQLTDLGANPIEIDEAIREFEKTVKVDNSAANVSGQNLWIDDSSPLKSYLPSAHDYDKRDKKPSVDGRSS